MNQSLVIRDFQVRRSLLSERFPKRGLSGKSTCLKSGDFQVRMSLLVNHFLVRFPISFSHAHDLSYFPYQAGPSYLTCL